MIALFWRTRKPRMRLNLIFREESAVEPAIVIYLAQNYGKK